MQTSLASSASHRARAGPTVREPPPGAGTDGPAGCLRVRLLGGFTLAWGEMLLPSPPSLSARSLFAYLITHRDRPHTRDLLAGLFWPDLPDALARRRLSQALWQIGRVLSPLPSPAPYLLTDADTVQFNAAAPYWLDVEEFGRLVDWETGTLVDGETGRLVDWETSRLVDRSRSQRTSLPAYQSTNLPRHQSTNIPILRAAVDLYRGDFLAGFYDDWMIGERERLRELFLAALGRLTVLCKREGAYEDALGYTHRLVAEDPLNEEGHREVMRLCFLLGRHHEVQQQYEQCRALLAAELGVEPAAATTALYHEIIAQDAAAERPYLPQAALARPAPLLEGTGPAPLVGRTTERAALIGWLEQAGRGYGGLALLAGESGIGKTSLLEAVARDAEWRGMQVLWGRGRELANAPPYEPLIEALRAGLSPLRAGQLAQLVEGGWLREVSRLLPQMTEWLPGLPPHISLGPEQERARLLEALSRIVLALGQIAPHLLILDDLHWADEDTFSALNHLAARLPSSRVLVIGSYRSGEALARPATWEALQALDRFGQGRRLELARLTAAETGLLVQEALGLTQAVPYFAGRLYRETVGNPLFVLEILRSLYDERVLYRDRSGQWSTPWDEITADYAELPLPTGVRQVIARRLARLGPDERAVLNAAAVLGEEFGWPLLLHVSGQDRGTCVAAAGELVRRRLLEEGPATYRFSHDQVRRAAYAEIPEDERRRLHRRAGDALEAQQPQAAGALAYHFSQAHERDKAVAYGLLAGDQARSLYAYTGALAHYDQALALVREEDLTTRWQLQQRREEALDVLGRREAQAAILAEMMQLAVALGDDGRRAVTLFRQGHLQASTGAPREGLAPLQEAAELARRRGEYTLAGKCCIEMGRAQWHMGDARGCLACAEEAKALFQQANDRTGEISALNLMGNLYLGLLSHYEQALRCFEHMMRIAQELGLVEHEHVARGNAGIALMSLGCYQQSNDYLAGAEAFFTQIGHKLWQAVIAFGQSNNYLGLRNYDASQSAAERCLTLCREIGECNFEIEALNTLGLIALARGGLQQAAQHFEQALLAARAGEQPQDAALQQSYLALVNLGLGEAEKAQSLSAESVSIIERLKPAIFFLEVIYFHRYQVVARLEGAEAAHPYLERAYQSLLDRANAIQDPELRRSFLEHVRENREIVAAYRAWQRGERSMQVRLPRAAAPTGRPLREDEWVKVTWTVVGGEDEAIGDKVNRRQHRLLRLLREAEAQGAAATVDDLAAALAVSRATIKRDLAGLRATGQAAHTRGSRSG